MLSGTNLQNANSYNVRIVLESIRLYGPLSRIDIARQTNLTAQTVTNITKKLMHAGLIYESDRHQVGRGAPSIMLELNKNAAYSIGLDFDKDHLTGILVDLHGNMRQHVHMDVDYPSPDEVMDLMTQIVDDMLQKEGVDKDLIWGVGVGFPGPLVVSEKNVFSNAVSPEALPDWEKVPVVDILEKRLNLPVFLENNASAAAIGERWYGSGKHVGNFFYLFFGAGLGGGLVLNGQLFSGHAGNAGEIGYMPLIDTSGSGNNNGKHHLGEYFNLSVLYKKLSSAGVTAKSSEDLEELFESENGALLTWIDNGVKKLAPLILAIEYIVDPQVIYLGGRLPNNMITDIKSRLETTLPELRIGSKINNPELQLASAGLDTAALGVATIPLYTSLAPLPKLLMKKSTKQVDSIYTGNKKTF